MSSKQDTQVTSIDDEPDAAAAAAAKPATAPKAKAKSAAGDAGESAPVSDGDLSGKRVMLTIHAGRGDGGNDAVFVGHNGVGYLIPRGTPFDVPVEVVNSLKLAVETVYTTEGKNTIERTVPRFAITVEAV